MQAEFGEEMRLKLEALPCLEASFWLVLHFLMLLLFYYYYCYYYYYFLIVITIIIIIIIGIRVIVIIPLKRL